MEFLFIIIGFVLLIKASDYFVEASTSIAKIFGVSEIIIGATIVSIGTTLPETMVSATSAMRGYGDIAYGNALGSIICNTALISAISLIFAPRELNRKDLKIPVTFFFSSFALYILFAYAYNEFSRIAGIILVSIFAIYILFIISTSKSSKEDMVKERNESYDHKDKLFKIIKSLLIIIVSAAVIAFASNLLVDNGTLIAKKFGVPESVIGITILALGTSLPELSTAITALVKGHNNLSLGNVIGANFFNVVLVTGIASILGPFNIPTSRIINGINSSLLVEVPIAFTVMIILCLPSMLFSKTKRWQGIALLGIYCLFLCYQFKP